MPYRGWRSRYRLEVWIQAGNDIVSFLQVRLHICNVIRCKRTLQQRGDYFDGRVGLAACMNVLSIAISLRHDEREITQSRFELSNPCVAAAALSPSIHGDATIRKRRSCEHVRALSQVCSEL